MKKLSLLLIALFAITLSSCLGGDKENKNTLSLNMLHRVTDSNVGGTPILTLGEYVLTLNYDKNVCTVAMRTSFDPKMPVTNFYLEEIPMTYSQSEGYVFKADQIIPKDDNGNDNPNYKFTSFRGRINNNMVLLSYMVNDKEVMAIPQFSSYSNPSTSITAGDGSVNTTKDMSYGIYYDPVNMTAQLYLFNLMFQDNSVRYYTYRINGLKVTTTTGGFQISADESTPLTYYDLSSGSETQDFNVKAKDISINVNTVSSAMMLRMNLNGYSYFTQTSAFGDN